MPKKKTPTEAETTRGGISRPNTRGTQGDILQMHACQRARNCRLFGSTSLQALWYTLLVVKMSEISASLIDTNIYIITLDIKKCCIG